MGHGTVLLVVSMVRTSILVSKGSGFNIDKTRGVRIWSAALMKAGPTVVTGAARLPPADGLVAARPLARLTSSFMPSSTSVVGSEQNGIAADRILPAARYRS
ncbi:hypothetical protein GCM10023166_05680 [Paeniglutamicibacter cryotolerans]